MDFSLSIAPAKNTFSAAQSKGQTMEQNTTELSTAFQQTRDAIGTQILGQQKLVDRLLIALLSHGHLLVEGAPGLAKTTAIKVLSECIEGDFHRSQFTPAWCPPNLPGSYVYRD